jgi:hypothetical protein
MSLLLLQFSSGIFRHFILDKDMSNDITQIRISNSSLLLFYDIYYMHPLCHGPRDLFFRTAGGL